MSDSDDVSEYPSDLEYEIESDDYIVKILDSGIESNDGYLTDEINPDRRDERLSRNRRIFRKRVRRYLRQN